MKDEKTKDQVALGPFVGPNTRVVTRRRDEENIEVGTVRMLKEGQPIPENAEVIQVEDPNCVCGGWQDATTVYKRGTSDGPAQVATPAYRDGYDRIFGRKHEVGLA